MIEFKQILCPVDLSESSVRSLAHAAALAHWLAEEEPRASAHFNVPEYRRYVVADAEERLRVLVAGESRTWSEIDSVVVLGRAHREILRAAAAKPADLIVMGAQGRGGMDLALFGSTTQQVIRGAPCPVLTVRGPQQA
ncbi:MAG: universal stress protein [Gammaproteobacteria bacterium]